MQSVRDAIQGVRMPVNKSVESVSSSDIVKKIVVSTNSQDRECNRVPRVTNSSSTPLNTNQGDTHFPTKIGDKYLLLDQTEGSSLYRCVNIATKDELVCKLKRIPSFWKTVFRLTVKSEPRKSLSRK
ncbi:hypothetical protein WA026_010602 [Henosepilachna vigintioctopunctata]|uniref:Uncharacterized protein n=1 Tax=Henosepilachna vigintioctopunctata TaxID=420089 RepID=A0AAW1VBZ9_9CUCU